MSAKRSKTPRVIRESFRNRSFPDDERAGAVDSAEGLARTGNVATGLATTDAAYAFRESYVRAADAGVSSCSAIS